MPTFSIGIHNDTDFTPEISEIQLTNCKWVYTQELHVGQPVGPHKRVAGMVEPIDEHANFRARLVLKYSYVPPGPDGAEVVIEFGVLHLSGVPGGQLGADTGSPYFDLSWQIAEEGEADFIGAVDIKRK